MSDNLKQYPATYVGLTQNQSGHVFFKNRKMHFLPLGSSENQLIWDEFSILVVCEGDMIEVRSTLEKVSIFLRFNKQIEKELAQQMNISVNNSFISWLKSHEWMMVMIILGAFIVGASLFLVLVRTQADRLVPFVSKNYETEYGADIFKKGFAQKVVKVDESLNSEWLSLTEKLTSLPELKSYKWSINIIRDKEVNAFALPGGFISINTGFIENADSAEEILGVIAHEMGHVIKRHSVKHVVRETAASFFKVFLGAGFVGAFVDQADHINSLSYSRGQELEADTSGFFYLKKAKISAEGFKNFFSKKRPGETKFDTKWIKWISTHPTDAERLKNISLYSENQKHFTIIKFPLAAFKKSLVLNN